MNKSETRRRSSGRITLSDVAKAAGVSPITASRALRGERGVAQELVQRVKDAAQQLGYVPDPAARALASQRSVQVPVLVPLLSNALFVDVLESVHRTLFPEGYQALIGVTHYDPQEEEQLLRTYLAHRPAGLLVTGFDRTEAARQLIAASGVPCVHLMEMTPAPGVFCVGFSQQDAGHSMTAHLLASGAPLKVNASVKDDESHGTWSPLVASFTDTRTWRNISSIAKPGLAISDASAVANGLLSVAPSDATSPGAVE